MRLGIIAGVVFLVIMMGLIFGVVQNESLINAEVERNLESVQDIQLAIEDFGWTSPIELVKAGSTYFTSLFTIVWQVFDTPFTEGTWALIPYIFLSPFIIPIVLMLIMLFIAILRSNQT